MFDQNTVYFWDCAKQHTLHSCFGSVSDTQTRRSGGPGFEASWRGLKACPDWDTSEKLRRKMFKIKRNIFKSRMTSYVLVGILIVS